MGTCWVAWVFAWGLSCLKIILLKIKKKYSLKFFFSLIDIVKEGIINTNTYKVEQGCVLHTPFSVKLSQVTPPFDSPVTIEDHVETTQSTGQANLLQGSFVFNLLHFTPPEEMVIYSIWITYLIYRLFIL
jgi:hypothetical protein